MPPLKNKHNPGRNTDIMAEPGRSTRTGTGIRPARLDFSAAGFQVPAHANAWEHPLRRSHRFTRNDLHMI